MGYMGRSVSVSVFRGRACLHVHQDWGVEGEEKKTQAVLCFSAAAALILILLLVIFFD